MKASFVMPLSSAAIIDHLLSLFPSSYDPTSDSFDVFSSHFSQAVDSYLSTLPASDRARVLVQARDMGYETAAERSATMSFLNQPLCACRLSLDRCPGTCMDYRPKNLSEVIDSEYEGWPAP
jgi:hypothetical protein